MTIQEKMAQHDQTAFFCVLAGLVLFLLIMLGVAFFLRKSINFLRGKKGSRTWDDLSSWDVVVGVAPASLVLIFMWAELPGRITPDPRKELNEQEYRRGLEKQKEAEERQRQMIEKYEKELKKGWEDAMKEAQERQRQPMGR